LILRCRNGSAHTLTVDLGLRVERTALGHPVSSRRAPYDWAGLPLTLTLGTLALERHCGNDPHCAVCAPF